MKRLLYIVLITFACSFLIGCSTTRKTSQTATEQHITSSTNEDRHTENQSGEAVNVNQNTNTFTSAVIEFTKTEYFDGTVKVDTTGHSKDCATPRPHDRESNEPPNHGGVKSITTGRIDLNSEKNESTNADIKRESETKSDERISEDKAEDNTIDSQTEEKPKRGFFYYLSVVIGSIISLVALGFIAYGIYRIRKKN